MSRVYQGHQVTAIAIVRLVRLVGSTVARASASSSDGKARKMSVTRMITSSTQPPKSPATIPSGIPMTHAISSTMTATRGEILAP